MSNPMIARPEGVDEDLWEVLSERLRDFLARHPECRSFVDASIQRDLPSFIDLEWVKARLNIGDADLQNLHRMRYTCAMVVAMTDWPDTKEITFDEMALVHLQAMRLPAGHYLLSKTYEAASRQPQSLFGGFSKYFESLLAKTRSFGSTPETRMVGVRRLAESGNMVETLDYAYFASIPSGEGSRYTGDPDELPDSCRTEVSTIIERRKVFMDRFVASCGGEFEKDLDVRAELTPDQFITRISNLIHGQPDCAFSDFLEDLDNEGRLPSFLVDDPAPPERPTVRLPSFVTREWLRQHLGLSAAVRSQIHRGRDLILRYADTEAFWPASKPGTDEITDRLFAALSMPHVLTQVNLNVLAREGERAGSWDASPFKIFYKKIAGITRNVVPTPQGIENGPNGTYDFMILEHLLEDGHIDLAREFCVLRGSELYDEDFLGVVAAIQGFEEVAAFLFDRRQLKAWWDGAHPDLVQPRFRRAANCEILPTGEQRASYRIRSAATPDSNMLVKRPWPVGAGTLSVEDATEFEGTVDMQGGISAFGDDERAAWVENLARLSSTAMALVSADPAPDALASLRACLDAAEAAANAWELARPKLVDAAPYAARLQALRADLARMIEAAGSDHDVPNLPAVEFVAPDVQADIERAVAAAETEAVSARQAEADIETLNAAVASETRLVRKVALGAEVAAAVGLLLARIEESARLLGSAADLLVGAARNAPAASARAVRADASPADVVEASAPSTTEELARSIADVAPAADDPSVVDDAVEGIEPEAAPLAAPAPVAEDVVATDDRIEASMLAVSGFEEADDIDPVVAGSDLDLMTAFAEGPEAPAAASASVAGTDPMIERVDGRLLSLMASRQFGLAHHLAAAAEILNPDASFALSAQEMRFASAAGRLDHAFLQTAPHVVAALLANGLDALDALPSASEGPVAAARRILMYPTALELVLFHPDSGAVEVLRLLNGLVDEVQEENARLVESAMNVARSRLPLSPAVLSHVSNTIEAQSGAEEIRVTLLARIEAFSRTSYSFQLGTRIRAALHQSDGLVGALRDGMTVKDPNAAEAAARDFVKATETRSLIIDAFDRAEVAVSQKFRGLDGAVRDRMVAVIQEIRTLASEYLGRRTAARIVSAQDTPRIREAVSDLRRRLGATISALQRLADGDNAHLASAAEFAADRYLALDLVLAGDVRMVGPSAHMAALHGSLPLLETLQFGRSWLPTPYDPAEVVEAVVAAPDPLLPAIGPARDEAYEAIVRRRIDDGSLVGARMLIELAAEHGVSAEAATSLRNRIGADEEAAREDLRREAEDARTLIERVMRFGSLSRPEDAVRLASVVDRVAAAPVPVQIPLDDRPEEVDVERIYDVKLASALLAEACEEARGLLDEPRNRLIARIDAMAARLPAEDIQRLRSLCADDDLLTAEEIVALAEAQGAIVIPTRHRRSRFALLENEMLPSAVAMGRGFAEAVAEAIAVGRDLPGAAFSELSPSRRERSAEIFAAWRELFRHVEGGLVGTATALEAGALLESLGIALQLREVSKASSSQRRLFVADWTGFLPTDAESHLLPDFGSLTHGGWRTAVTTTLPGDAILADIVKSAGASGVMLLVAEVVSKERRERFLLQNLEARRRICLIDAASFVQTLAEPDLRGLTPIELGQPYSFAWPFRDYEREAVPRELFVGRRQEMETLFEATGSCVVYGGRRIGKTALLKHLVETRNAPSEGTLVAFVDAQEIGSSHLPKKIWDDLQKALPAVFERRAPGADQRRIAEEIERWLKADPRRRILVLIDEADDFVRADAAQSFAVFHQLQALMTNTGRRFKFVLSGLHNVTRIAQVGNAPILQISSNPQRIGPLMGAELKDAEDLVVRSFAAMGIQFERREDVWRLLSHANYYPVLAQTLAKHLLEQVFEEAVRTGRAPRTIGRGLVSRIFETRTVRDEVRDKFLMTLRIDTRYELLAYVVADLVLGNEASGVIEEGVSVRLIRARALECWPNGFADPNRVSLFDDLVDEMEGLGILRQVGAGRWTLRSTAVTRLLGTRDEVETKLLGFFDRPGPNEFDPKSHRRHLDPAVGYENEDRRPSPLTLVQERDLLADPTPVKLVFGTPMADVDLVSLALRTAPGSFSDGARFDVVAQVFSSQRELMDKLRQARGSERTTVVVVDVRTDWTPEWVVGALKVRAVVEKAAKVVFVGASRHASAYAADPRFVRLTTVRAMPLEPWSSAFMEAQLMRSNAVVGGEVRDALRGQLGGWNAPLSSLFQNGRGGLAQRVERLAAEMVPSSDTAIRLGLDGGLGAICSALAELVDPTAAFNAGDIAAILDLYPHLAGRDGALGNAEAVCSYGVLVGAFETISAARTDDGKGATYAFAPLTRRFVAAPLKVAA